MDPLDHFDPLNTKIYCWKGGRYRIIARDFSDTEVKGCKNLKVYEAMNGAPSTSSQDGSNKVDEEPKVYCEEDWYDSDDDCVVNYQNGKYKTTICIPKQFFPQIVGSQRTRQKSLEKHTETQIHIPNQYQGDVITIFGTKRENVVKAYRQIELISEELRNKCLFTHFLGISVSNDTIKENFNTFKSEILSGEPISGVEESIFQKVQKLHLTLGLMTLLSNREIKDVCDVMKECEKNILRPAFESYGPMKIILKGLGYMNDDPSDVNVLYAKIDMADQQENFQSLCDKIVSFFHENGIIKMEKDNIKLHCTVMNTKYRAENPDEARTTRYPKRIPFDARPILEKYNEFYFGEVMFKGVELLNRTRINADGYYAIDYLIKY